MSNPSPLAYSGERLSFFQLFSHKRLKVEIPIIQRDYAQGRDNQSAVRAAFLDALYLYLKEGRSNRDLDFIYGSIIQRNDGAGNRDDDETAGRFIPLDGQQRLTTLFLLHWYLGQISGQAEFLRGNLSVNGRSLFTYETRSSSREFCDALMSNDLDFEHLLMQSSGHKSISATIQDAGWFYLSWASDPTISAMLTMLEAIHHKFDGKAEFFDRLVDEEKPVITFLFLNLHEFKLTDDLYIKMNARGWPLTHFENFKAQLGKKLKAFEKPWPAYNLEFRDAPVSGYEYFIHKIDTDWADVFWGYRNLAKQDNTYDDELMNFIALVVANEHLLNGGRGGGLFGSGGTLARLSFVEYEELGCLSQHCITQLITMLDLLHHGGLREGRIMPYLDANSYYAEEETFKRVIKNTSSYPDKLRFFAFYGAVANGLKDTELLSWMRVVFNLTENTIINTLDDYSRALKAIHELLEQDQNILDLLKSNAEIGGFTKDQIIEEKIKAHLITRSTAWSGDIIELEVHPFFRGQIGFILKFSGVIEYYFKHGDTSWGDQESEFLERFRHYSRSASAVFSSINKGSDKINYAWERAVLTKGMYFTATTAHRFNLLSTRLSKNNIERDHSWKRLLRTIDDDSYWDQKQNFVKSVFDDPDFDSDNVSESLETLCSVAMSAFESENWRKILIEEPQLFKVCNQGFIVLNSGEVLLLHESQRNHLHSELYTKYLELKLARKNYNLSPFGDVKYVPSRATDVQPCLSLSGWRFEGGFYRLEISYKSDHYQLRFAREDGEPFGDILFTILDEVGFIRGGIDLGEQHLVFSFACKTSDEAMGQIASLCESLRKLKDD